jgi:chromosome segregation ATPase
MKNFQQNLLMALALALCGLCAGQWYFQTVQRGRLEAQNKIIAGQDTAIQGYTNSLDKQNHQVARMEKDLAGLSAAWEQAVKTNREANLEQRREIARLGANNDTLLSDIAQYTNAVATLQSNLDTAYDGIKKQNAVVEQLASQRDEYIEKYTNMVAKYNDTVNLYNGLMGKYTNLVDRFNKLQATLTNKPGR